VFGIGPVCALLIVSGCSFFLAGFGSRDDCPGVGPWDLGATNQDIRKREVIFGKLGSPVETITLPYGGRVVGYECSRREGDTDQRMNRNLSFTMGTGFFYEILGTPRELVSLSNAEKIQTFVTYSSDNRVTAIEYKRAVPGANPIYSLQPSAYCLWDILGASRQEVQQVWSGLRLISSTALPHGGWMDIHECGRDLLMHIKYGRDDRVNAVKFEPLH